MRNRTPRMLCGTLMFFMVAACTDDGSNEKATLSASQVCDSTLHPPSAAALARLASTDHFTELTGTNQLGDATKFSLRLAAKRLHRSAKERNACWVYKAGDNRGIPLLIVEFEPSESHPAPDEEARKAESDRLVYPLGSYAEINGVMGANLYFSCSTKGLKGTLPFVRASMYSSGGQLAPGSTPDDRMAVLNDVARGLTEELGCAAEAALPARIPAPTNG
ncbi:hypothetical protein [Streptomyces sp. V2I9]|uniref:hypothetical protein n=1 Tax=Streptomyces sp. V2I9 TaxID=3042304 RepID=UPI0027834F24|nr:hypothetical protein [Streptomyces sp. V2I9]MDQ0984766.1 hypothetical protein [Streptomyces sp. V2I9]